METLTTGQRLSVFTCQHQPSGSNSPNNHVSWQFRAQLTWFFSETALLCKTGRLWQSLPGFPVGLCVRKIGQCHDGLWRLCVWHSARWPRDSSILLVGWLPWGSALLKPLHAEIPHLPMDLCSPLQFMLLCNTQTELHFTFSASKRWRSSKYLWILLILTTVLAVPESLTGGSFLACSQSDPSSSALK